MKSFRYLVIMLSTVMIGCSIPYPYDGYFSRAYNIIRAGGISDTGIHDSSDGMRSYGKSLLMQALNLASLATSFQGSSIGLSGSATFLVNSASILSTPENQSARPSLMAWIPKYFADSESKARDYVIDATKKSLESTASNMNLLLEKLPRGVKDPVINNIPLDFWEVTAPEHGCKKGHCIVAIYINDPIDLNSPEFLQEEIGKKCYKLSASGRKDVSVPPVTSGQ